MQGTCFSTGLERAVAKAGGKAIHRIQLCYSSPTQQVVDHELEDDLVLVNIMLEFYGRICCRINKVHHRRTNQSVNPIQLE